MSEEQEYQYAGLPLSPAIIGEIASRKFAGQVVKRDAIRQAVVAYHVENGGVLTSTDPTQQTKKALQDLAAKGAVEKSGAYGLWRFIDRDDALPFDFAKEESVDEDVLAPIAVIRWIGTGSQLVYVYSFPTYADHANAMGDSVWPCKIGRSDRQSVDRISEQIGTSTPEWPTVHLGIRCDDSRLLERYLHSALRLEGAYLSDVPGAEWFRTSPDHVIELIRVVAPEICEEF
jgi:hypothetical protein